MCQVPCWPTPDEAEKIIAAGFGDKLRVEKLGIILVLSPKLSRGRCTFQDSSGMCGLHDKGLKPLEGRFVLCTKLQMNLSLDEKQEYDSTDMRFNISQMWKSQKGRAIIENFTKEQHE